MSGLKILVPYNFSAHEEKALDWTINAFAGDTDNKITLFNVYAPLPVIDMDANPELGKMRGGMVSLSEEVRQKEGGLKSAKQHLLENGFSDDQIDYVFKEREKDVAQEIIDTILKGHYRVLVLSRQSGKVTRLFSRSVHTKVLSTVKDITVCVVA
ncbi:MAG: universal stress protein [Deltaproteobacteria bacterium]|nr:universal stress protein [Deltaproteobacteria bacterium]